MATLESYGTLSPGVERSAPEHFRRTVLLVGGATGDLGFTVDDLRAWFALRGEPFLANPGASLGALVKRGILRQVGETPSEVRSSKGRRVRRFVLTGGSNE
jgi:hypothetical protein